MSLTTKVLLALVAGLALGILLATTEVPGAAALTAILDPIGTLFINAIRMTVIPLVVSSLVVGVSSAPDPRAVGRIGARAILVFVVIIAAAAAFGILVGGPLIALFPLDPDVVASLRSSALEGAANAAERAQGVQSLTQWLVSLVPVNPVGAAANGAMLPLIVFTVLFATALLRIEPGRRMVVVRFFEGLQDASLVLVRAILSFAPLGVFALAVPLAARMGISAIGALASYIVIVSAACALFGVALLYPAAALFGRVGLRDFARAALPAQGIAFSARSSLAALPAMLEAAPALRLPPALAGFFLPLAASMFRAGSGVGQAIGVIFLARLYGVDLGAAELLSVGLATILTTFSVPGVPAGSMIVMIPVLTAAGVPIEGIAILIGVDTIPDMFRTATNVTGHMTASVILARGERDEAPDTAGGPGVTTSGTVPG
jgi:proton glutamate symport protein